MPMTLLMAAVCLATPAQELDISFEKYQLESNGLTVILHQDRALPVVAVEVWYAVGPINEPPNRSGFAHLFEHLMFQGSKHVGDDAHFKMLEASGASTINGTTSYDRTNYFEVVPSNQLELALWLESDRMGFLPESLTQEKLDNQREVVKEERRQTLENRPYGPSGEALVQQLFPPDHPYYGFIIGSMQDLNAATLEDVRAFYDQFYAPANATLSIAGDIDIAATKALVDKYFASLPRRSVAAPRAVKSAAVTAEKRVEVKEPVRLGRIAMGWLSPPAFQPGDAECDLLAFVLGDGKSSRLYRRLVYDLQLAQSVNVSQASYQLSSMFQIVVTARPGVDMAKLETELQNVLEELKANPPSERELTRARNMILTTRMELLQNVGGGGGRSDMLAYYNHYVQNPGFISHDVGRYYEVTAERVQQMAKDLLDSSRRVVVITVPQS
jgi:zinc protease